ncbi:DeoR family transcriptional regulator, partial [Bacillus sp. MBGLi79]|uniref:DeoR family transcriptional regulator n=1 Tax=Bacillus sp. MBGLi79 TaxID=2070759 RepID=UPI001AD81E53
RFNVTLETIRSDLKYLENEGLIKRCYGGDETLKRAVDDKNGVFNFFDIQELGGRNYPRF